MPKKRKKHIRNVAKKEITIKLGLIVTLILFIYIVYEIFNIAIFSKEKVNLSDDNLYQYFYGMKEEYKGKKEIYETKEEIGLILENGSKVELDSVPIYYEDILGKALFAKDMELVNINGGNYKLSKFTNIIQENNLIYAKKINKKNKTILDNAFIYDGKDLYFFLDEMQIKIGEQEYTLSPLSFAIVNYRNSIEFYNYEKNEYTIINDENTLNIDALAICNLHNYTINMSVDSVNSEKNSKLLISNINNLQELEY